MSVTIYDIAQKAEVSPATVSRVLNDSTLVSKHTKKKVLAVASELGYQTKADQQERETKTVAILVSSVLNPTLTQMIKGAQIVLRQHGYATMIFDSDGKVHEEIRLLRNMKEARISGLIVSSPNFNTDHVVTLRQLQLPFVFVFGYSSEPDVPCVYINNVEASFSVVHKLFQLGHRDIAIISGPSEDLTISRERLQGARLAYMAKMTELDETTVIEGDYTIEAGYQGALTILDEWDHLPSAVYAFSDLMAIGAMKAFQERGLNIPEDISVCGFDGIDMASVVTPTLSTLVQSAFNVGQESAQMLVELFNEGTIQQLKRELPYELVMRDSVQNKRG